MPKIFAKIKNLFQIKKSLYLIIVLFLLIVFIPVKNADAILGINIEGFTLEVIRHIGSVIFGVAFQIIAIVGNILLGISTHLLRWVTSTEFIGLSYTNPSNNFILEKGWTLTRDLANIGFVIVLIIIGLATALRIREYQWQRLLPRLIAIIILINFTPVIIGLIVDASNVLMNSLLSKTASWETVAGVWKQWEGNALDFGEAIFYPSKSSAFFANSAVLAFFGFTGAAIFFVFAVLFIMRYVAIWVLVILSPIAFFAYILPGTRKYFHQWWQQLLQWSFVGATAAFFLYLAHHLLSGRGQLKIATTSEAGEAVGIIGGILPYVVVIIFLYLGFFVSLKSSAYGANTIIGWARRREKGIIGWTGRKARVGAQVAIKSERFKKIADRIATAPTIFGKLIRPLGRAMQRLPGEQEKIFDKAESEAKNMDAARVATQVTKGTIPGLREPGRVAGLLSGAAEDLDKAKDIIKKYNISSKEIVNAIKWTFGQGKIDKAKKMFRGYGETLTEKGIRPEDVGLKFDLNKEKDREEALEFGMTFEDAKKAGFSDDMATYYKNRYKEHEGYLGKMLADARTVDEIKSFKNALKSDEPWVQKVIHKFWDGTQLHRAGEEIGAAFIEKFQDAAKDEFYYIKENPKMHKYLSSTAAQSAGYSFGSSEAERLKKLAEDNEAKFKLEMAMISGEVKQAKGKKRQDLINELTMYERILATKKAKEWKEKEEAEIGPPGKKKRPKKVKGLMTKARLRSLGYTEDQIKKIFPEETEETGAEEGGTNAEEPEGGESGEKAAGK